MQISKPSLTRVTCGKISFHTDIDLYEKQGIRIAFTERGGGVSKPPYESLDLGLHVGDDPACVMKNREAVLRALEVGDVARSRLVSAHQVHGTHTAVIGKDTRVSLEPLPDTDALATDRIDTPLLLCFADCVPVIMVSPRDPRAISVVHSGWRGTLEEISAVAARRMQSSFGVDPRELMVYIGPYIGPKNFQVSLDIASQFAAKFDTLSKVAFSDSARVPTPNDTDDGTVSFDLADAIRESLMNLGVLPCNIVSLDVCSVETTKHFYSYRAENGVTGRHGALACMR